ILDTGYVPAQLKEGILSPVLKKKKDASQPTNYRGITVLSILGKILERVLLNRTKDIIEKDQSKLQRGFTCKSSAVNAALILSEAQNEAKDSYTPLRLVTLDACKAFDVVWQDSLLRKMFNAGVQGNLWWSVRNLYVGAQSVVKWNGNISSPFEIKQGVRQGGILSTTHYKLFNNDLLILLRKLGVGMSIGHIDCCAPTCADDVALLATTTISLLLLLYVVNYYIGRERYCINASKSADVVLYGGKKVVDNGTVRLGGDVINRSPSEVHLGVDRNQSGRVDIEARVQTGRRTMYAMMGAGAFGCSGVAPPLVAHLWKTFALPRMLYSLEVFQLAERDITQLERLQRSTLRRILNLPVNVALTAVYGLLGLRPIRQELDLRKLTLLGSILLQRDTLEYEIAQRQLSVKSIDSGSWFSECNRLLYKYGLPNIYTADKEISTLKKWKQQIKEAIDSYIHSQWVSDCKKSLKYLNIDSLQVGKMHHSLSSLPNNVRDVKKANTKLRLLTGTYILQENRVKFNQYVVDDTCTLCLANAESREHFLVECSSLEKVRQQFKPHIVQLLSQNNAEAQVKMYLSKAENMTQLLLDSSLCGAKGGLVLSKEIDFELEKLTRNWCFALHRCRSELLGLKLRD
ncbi:MAG: reverse transcriptase family protein, partial [Candidatus Thiodiazotropha sp.]